jgi:hypothetical protein
VAINGIVMVEASVFAKRVKRQRFCEEETKERSRAQ